MNTKFKTIRADGRMLDIAYLSQWHAMPHYHNGDSTRATIYAIDESQMSEFAGASYLLHIRKTSAWCGHPKRAWTVHVPHGCCPVAMLADEVPVDDGRRASLLKRIARHESSAASL